MHKPNICVLITLILAWILLIVAFASYWYQSGTNTDNGDSYTLFKHDGFKFCNMNGDCDSDSYPSSYKKANKNTLNIFNASLAFTVLSWIVTSVTILFVFLSLANILSKIPLPLGMIVKFLPIVALVFALLAMFIFIGVGNASYQDCKKNLSDFVCDDQKDNGVYDFVKYEDNNGVVDYHAPTTGWATVVVSSGLLLLASILNVLMGKY
ncbi:hypothetical protein DFA_05858 [Cavenderia fasciculata]|uniref:Transmembrane protein n=1 Tax=Cavenderia fasciculata TaxID=261658 RepID=F4PN34_CACFS|nr:uncharacterized protein DFA_05858 [Cavenderia fasciculata]EGG23724.1 hypothetical protein DFA_05858 [Cavenderia fasciculata]|eukprot:XP_004361575.1 hypothetical protein DFA_05858 [Cavenderia fasciculata]